MNGEEMPPDALQDMNEHWLLEFVDFDAFDHMDNHFGPPKPEDSQVTATDNTTNNAVDDAVDNTSADTLGPEEVTGQTSDEKKLSERALSELDNEPHAEMSSEANVPLVPDDVEMGLQGIQPRAANQVKEGLKDIQPRAPNQIKEAPRNIQPCASNQTKEAPKDIQPRAPKQVKEALKAGQPRAPKQVKRAPKVKQPRVPKQVKRAPKVNQPRAPNHVETNLEFANRGSEQFEMMQKAAMPAFDVFNPAWRQITSQESQSMPLMQNAGMPVGACGFDSTNHTSHQTGLLQLAQPLQNAGDFDFNWMNQPPLPTNSLSAPWMQNAGMPVGDSGFGMINQPSHQTNLQSANQMQNSGMPVEAFGFNNNQLSHQANFQVNFQANFQPNFQPDLQAEFLANFQPNFQPDLQANVQGNFQLAPVRPNLPTPQAQVSRSHGKPGPAGKKTLPKAINPNVQSSTAQNEGDLEMRGKRKVSGEEEEPRRVSASKDACEPVTNVGNAPKRNKPAHYTLTGDTYIRSFRGNSMTSYRCSDGFARILTDASLEQAIARTAAKYTCNNAQALSGGRAKHH
ncbi:hypothetical protein HRG_000938 [Hirsutella rhossiliensis]|uniref:Uncharacterized protein n=1 Tax=Hirsutella rhossiliensis TaxID=111463 RepID=A0A9P8SMR8_9HYPO|nr:uncharacterized protein HRG_00938 [Hirsutella rhossiliensis]KAH0968296.1 hypothetical protein HRG_00938 [Hirsutella rhossiliensis]